MDEEKMRYYLVCLQPYVHMYSIYKKHKRPFITAAIGRLTVGLVLVQLARGDCVAAEKAFREWGAYCEHEEVRPLTPYCMISLQSALDLCNEYISESPQLCIYKIKLFIYKIKRT